MIRNFTANYIFPITSEPIENGIVSVDENGEILGVHHADKAEGLPGEPLRKLDGIIVPGFVNSHCHLELSYLKGRIPSGEGLVSFVENVIDTRKQQPDEELITGAMLQAHKEMQEAGIVAVGDISNTAVSAGLKKASNIYYHTYIELLGFDPAVAASVFEKGLSLLEKFHGLPASLAPHAPYTVSKELFRLIRQRCAATFNLLSLHNQETEEENKFFRYKKGRFVELYERLNQNIDFFKPQARNSIQSIIPLVEEFTPILLVHNTFTSLKDIYFVRRFGRNITWCLCPKANLYIEGRLPKLDIFLEQDFDIALGTDSLASNDKLCILSELKVIQQHYPKLSLKTILPWSTLNGAKFLGIDSTFGSIEVGKRPGLNLISNVNLNDLLLSEESAVTPLA